MPEGFRGVYPGPQCGVAGTRRLTGMYDRPLFGMIIKPSVGLSPARNADRVCTLIASARACLTSLLGGYTVLPVFSSGQSARQVPDTYTALGSSDFLFMAGGGGILAHPLGPAAGVASLREAWDAVAAGVSLGEYAIDHPALREALEKYVA